MSFARHTSSLLAIVLALGLAACQSPTSSSTTISVTGVSLNKSSTSLVVGDTETLTATVIPANAANREVTWTSSSSSVATVSSVGLVTALAVGTTTITATTADGSKTAVTTATVVAPPATWQTVGVAGFSGGTEVQDMALDSSSNPYVAHVGSSLGGPVGVMRFNGTAWVSVGSPGFSNYHGTPSLALDASDTPYVAYLDTAASNKVSVRKFDGSAWVLVGAAGFSPLSAFDVSLAIDSLGTPLVAYRDTGAKASVMKFDGSAWVQVGDAGFSQAMANTDLTLALDASDTPYVAYKDSTNKLNVMKFNGSAWAQVGDAGFASPSYYAPSLAFDSTETPYVSYRDVENSYKATVKKLEDGAWVQVGTTELSGAGSNGDDTDLAFDSSDTLYLASTSWTDNGMVDVMKFDGDDWVQVGTDLSGADDAWGSSLVINASGTLYLSYSSSDAEETLLGVTVKKFE